MGTASRLLRCAVAGGFFTASYLSLATPVRAAPRAADVAACRLPSLTAWLDEGFPADFDTFLEPRGSLEAVMLFVDFPDAPIIETDPVWQGFDTYLDVHQGGADWLGTSSYARVEINLTARREWYRMTQPMSAYGLARGATFEQHAAYIAEAVALADADVDFAAYDIVYVVAGINAWAISNSPAYIDASDARVTADGVAISHAVTFGVDVWLWGEPYRQIVLAHETGHLFGLPDLYSFSGDTHQFVGGWDVMADIDGPAPGPFAWHRWKLGWIRDRQVACLDGPGGYTVRLTAVERRTGTKLAVIPTGLSTAYVIESRRASRLDAEACSTGVLIYEVDSAVATGSGPITITDATPGDTSDGRCADLDVATYGIGSRPATFTDSLEGIKITVERQTRTRDVVTVRIAD